MWETLVERLNINIFTLQHSKTFSLLSAAFTHTKHFLSIFSSQASNFQLIFDTLYYRERENHSQSAMKSVVEMIFIFSVKNFTCCLCKQLKRIFNYSLGRKMRRDCVASYYFAVNAIAPTDFDLTWSFFVFMSRLYWLTTWTCKQKSRHDCQSYNEF